MNLYNLEKIYALALEPEDKEKYVQWTSQDEVLEFLKDEATDEYIIIYASLPHVFLHTTLITQVELNEEVLNDIKGWSCNPYSSWAITCSSKNVWIDLPLSNSGSKALSMGEQIVFGRSFEAINNNQSYFELNQKIAHVLGIHFVSERNAWCKLDNHGDIVDVFKIINIDDFSRNKTGSIICVKKDELVEYLTIEKYSLIRMFDFSRYKSGDFSSWGTDHKSIDVGDSKSIYGSLKISPGAGSYSRGFQLIELRIPEEHIVNRVCGNSIDTEAKKYCTYIAHDWKNKAISEISCDPSCLSNYFTESQLPFEITPAFFRPEVLLKYKSDRAKYRLENRSISCRGTWYLKSFDINSAEQVHVYLIDLSKLPYEEQLHWKQYNEIPKAPLSARAIKTDFEGQFDEEYDPLPSLKYKLEKLSSANVGWWILRDKGASDKVHYPFTNSKDEWAEEILNLDQILVEGFEYKWLRKKAKELGCNPDDNLRALKLLEQILIASGFENEHAKKIMTPFHVVHNLRSILKGHTSGTEAESERKKALSIYGSYRKHFEKICADCDESIDIVLKALEGM
jgi:hypothetical protein